jgi:hypothetical protein
LFGGRFDEANGQPRSNLAVVEADGTLGPPLTPAWFETQFGSARLSFALTADGHVLIGWGRGGVFRYDSLLQPDPTFGLDVAVVGNIAHVVEDDRRRLLLGSDYGVTLSSGARVGAVRLLPDGKLDPSFKPFETIGSSLSAEPDGRVLVFGPFAAVEGHPSPAVARLLGDGTVDRSFASGLTTNSVVQRAVMLPGGDWVVAGDLEQAGVSGRWNVLVLRGDLDQRLLAPRMEAGHLRATLHTKPGRRYAVQFAPTVDAPWQLLREVDGTSVPAEIDEAAAGGGGFYRVVPE